MMLPPAACRIAGTTALQQFQIPLTSTAMAASQSASAIASKRPPRSAPYSSNAPPASRGTTGPRPNLTSSRHSLGQPQRSATFPCFSSCCRYPAVGASRPLDLTPQRKKERTLAALLRQLEGLARTQPVLMIFQDLHWIDPTSRELLDLILARIDHLPVLLVATFRQEFEPPWVGQPHVKVIVLKGLGRSDGAAMVQRLADEAPRCPRM